MKAVVHGEGEGHGPQQRQNDQEKRPHGVDGQRCRLEERFQKRPECLTDFLTELIPGSLGIHPGNRHEVFRLPAQFVKPFVELFITDKIGFFQIAEHRLTLQFILLCLVFFQIERLSIDQMRCGIADGRQQAVQRPQYEGREGHDAQPQHKGPQ